MWWMWHIIFWILFWGIVFTILVLAYKALRRWPFLTRVDESTAKVIVRGGAFRKMLFSKRDHRLDDNYNLKPDKTQKSHWYGGWRIVGWPWLDRVYTYEWSWVKVKQDSERGSILEPKGPEKVNFILVGQVYVYGAEIRGNDMVDKELVPVEASLALPAMIVNPRKALFDTTDWYGTFISLIEPGVRNYVNCNGYDDIIAKSKKDLGKDVFKSLKAKGIVRTLEKKYGVRLLSIECKGIRLAGDYQAAQLERWKGEQDAQKNAGIVTALVAAVANAKGIPLKEVQKEFNDNLAAALKKYKGFLDRSQALILRKLAYDAHARHEYDFNGASGGLDFATVLGNSFHGGATGNASPASNPVVGFANSSGPTAKKKSGDQTTEDDRAWYRKTFGREPIF